MKKSILFSLLLTIAVVGKAQLDSAAFTGSYILKIKSQEATLSSSNSATVDAQIIFYDTTYWDYTVKLEHEVYGYDRPWQGVLTKTSTDWWSSGSITAPTEGFYYAGDTLNISMNFSYNPNFLPYSFRSLKFNVESAAGELVSLEKAFIYFTPYNTLETWNYDDFLDLKRTWDSPEDGLLTTYRASYIHPDSIPQSNLTDEDFANDSFEYQYFSLPGLGYSVYGKFSSSWNGNSSNQRLRDWLNPTNDVFTLNGVNGCGQGMAVNLNITHTITSGSVELHQATNTITASNRIEAGATATYEAQTIVLTDGFVAEAGSNFVARPRDFNCVVTCDPMNLVAWTSFVCSGDDLCFLISNASTYSVKIHSTSGALVHQSSGSATNSPVCVWNTTGVASAIYNATVTFTTDCQEISNTYQLLVTSCKKSAGGSPDTEEEEKQEEKFVTSISDTTRLDFSFTVFPNPNDGSFSVKIPNGVTMPYSLEIINSVGKIMYSVEHLNANQVNVTQTGLTKGIYFIRIKSANRIATQKFIIQ